MNLPSILPVSSFASSSRSNYADHPEEPCLDCTMLTPECSEPLCSPFAALTNQCTDQCVVIACNDPDHAESSVCDKQRQCNINDIVDCTDCDGFEDFLQCCETYPAFHPVPPQSQRTLDAPQTLSWDASFNDVWCTDCTTKSTGLERQLDSNVPQYTTMQNGSQTTLQQRTYPSSHQENHQMNLNPDITSDARPPYSCMWGSCHASFSSPSELIGHVNLSHLVGSSATLPNNLVSVEDPQFEQIKPPTTCKWTDCANQAMSSFNDTNLLASHLLHEHLVLTSPSSSPLNNPSLDPRLPTSHTLAFDTTIDQDAPPQSNSNDNVQRQKTHHAVILPEPTSPTCEEGLHSCTGVHECKWKDCGLFFPTCAELTAHITVAHIGSGQAQYECFWDQCPRNGTNGFQSKQKICRHVQSHTGHRPFQCTICQQYFSEAATLQQHIRRHTQQKPYVCDYPGCVKSFAIAGALTIHKRTHNGDKPFKCPYCDRGFAESSNLSKHLRTHTGARPYVCTEPNCGKAFARPDQLNRHKSIHTRQHRVGG